MVTEADGIASVDVTTKAGIVRAVIASADPMIVDGGNIAAVSVIGTEIEAETKMAIARATADSVTTVGSEARGPRRNNRSRLVMKYNWYRRLPIWQQTR